MSSGVVPPSGSLLFAQPRGEYRLQKAVLFAFAAFFGGIALVFLLVTTNPPAAGPLTAAGAFAFAAFLLATGARMQPYRLYDDGIRQPGGRFLAYGEIRDFQRVDSDRGSKFLLLALRDGSCAVIGSPRTKHVIISTREFDRVESLIVDGVRRRGFQSDVEWEPDVWREIHSMIFRGPVIVIAEKAAREQGLLRIDRPFLDRLASENRRLRSWLRSAVLATAKAALQPKRNSTP